MFTIGDRVAWGYGMYRKVGKIVAVIPANCEHPEEIYFRFNGTHKLRCFGDRCTVRLSESYLVEVPDGRRMPFLYWPRVGTLQKIGSGTKSQQ